MISAKTRRICLRSSLPERTQQLPREFCQGINRELDIVQKNVSINGPLPPSGQEKLPS